MQIHYDFKDTENIKNAVVTTGSFDGVHIGHRFIINHIKDLAASINGVSVLITFWPHPRKVLFPETNGKDLQLINTQREKIELLSNTGLDHLVIVTFTPEFAKTSSNDFVTKILLEKLHAKIIVVGFNHHFGHNREGSYDSLIALSEKHDFRVDEIPEQAIQNETVSSTKIRQALNSGNLQKANAYLDNIFFTIGKKLHQNNLSNKFLKSYRIEIEEDLKLLPPEGYYAAYVKNENVKVKVLVVITCNTDSILNNHHKALYIIECPEELSVNLADEFCTIYFHKRMSTEFPQNIDEINVDEVNFHLEEIYNLIY